MLEIIINTESSVEVIQAEVVRFQQKHEHVPQGSLNRDSTMESKPPIYYVLLIQQYIYGRERNQDFKSYLDSKSSRKLRMNVRETSGPYKPK